jgi:hypothetical protein
MVCGCCRRSPVRHALWEPGGPPLGGGLGCLFMLLFSVIASVVLMLLANLLLR